MRNRLQWMGPRLSREIRGLYLPVARAVKLDAALIPGGWRLADNAQELARSVGQVFRWSDWDTLGLLYTWFGARYGSVGLKVVDDRNAQRVWIESLAPDRFILERASVYDSSPRLAASAMRLHDGEDVFEYAEIVEPDRIRTFRDGLPFGFGGRPAEYANSLGFVPFVQVHHIQTGEELGECTFQDVIPLLDEVNAMATDLANIVRQHAEPQWAVIGAEDGDLKRDGDNIWYVPQAGDVKAIVAPIDVSGVLQFITEVKNNVHEGLPELAFDELRKKDQIATATVELQLLELVSKIGKFSRPNYDEGLRHALRMCGKAAASVGGQAARLAELDTEKLAFDSAREVLPMDPLTALELERMRLEVMGLERQYTVAQITGTQPTTAKEA